MSGLQERYANIAIEDHSKTFNTERVAALELAFMLDVAEAMVNAAVRREESRGAHQRTDFPARDDERFLAHSLIYRNTDGSIRVEYLRVTITRWPPGERIYGEAAPHGGATSGCRSRGIVRNRTLRSRSTSTRSRARRTG